MSHSKKYYHSILLIFISVFLFNSTAYSVNEYFRSVASGNWNSTSTWEMSSNGGGTWFTATSTPSDTSGIITIQNPNIVTVTVNVDVDQLIVNNGGTISINNGVTLSLLNGGGNDLVLNGGGNISGAGTFKTTGDVTMIVRTGSGFTAPVRFTSGTITTYNNSSPFISEYGAVTLDTGAVITTPGGSYYNMAFSNVINYGTIGGNGFIMSGSSLLNEGEISPSILNFYSTTSLSGTGSYNATSINITSPGIVSLDNNVTFSPVSSFQINDGGTLNPNSKTFSFTSGTFYCNNGGTVTSSGVFRTQGNVTMILRNGSNFNGTFVVNSGITTSINNQSPYIADYFGTITLNPGGTMTTLGGSYTNRSYGNVTNNGTIVGNAFTMKGEIFTNNGTVSPTHFSFDSTVSLAGTGVWGGSNIYITGNGIVNLSNSLPFGGLGTVNFYIYPSGLLNPNSFDAIFDGTDGTVNFEIQNSGETENSGRIQSKGNTTFEIRNGSNFNTPFNIVNGSASIFNNDNPHESIINRTVTIDTGAVFTTPGGGYTCTVNDSVINNGTLTGPNTFRFMGTAFINNGIVSFSIFHFASMIVAPTSFHTLEGTGSFTTSNCQLIEGSNVTLLTDHQFRYLSVNAGSTFDLNSKTLKLDGNGHPIVVSGVILSTGGTFEYNGTGVQNFPQANIIYDNVRFNDTAGVTMVDNASASGLVEVTNGFVNLNGKIFTLLQSATLSETPGNTFTGNSGFLVTTRNLNAPNDLNVAGLGAQITTNANLGLTEIKRGHNVQTLPTGNQAVRRWYGIKPFNNSNLNATLVFHYDESELNGNEESKLSLFKSTNAGSSYESNGGTVNIVLNEVTQDNINNFARFTAGSSLGISLIMEGFYNVSTNNLNMSDTVRAYLRNTFAPYAIVDSSKGILDSLSFRSAFQFANATSGNYYIHLKHRNSLETWSKTGVDYEMDSTLNYDFTFAAEQAYGNNQTLKGTKYCLFSGDVNQDGLIDLTDVILISNAAAVFTTGYVNTDVNGNMIVDLTDMLIALNNANKFVVKMTP